MTRWVPCPVCTREIAGIGGDLPPLGLLGERPEGCTCVAPLSTSDAGVERAAIDRAMELWGYQRVQRRGACGHAIAAYAHHARELCPVCVRPVDLVPIPTAEEAT